MYHSITFGNKNTWDDWKLVAESRPVINPPTQKTKYVDVPGTSGSIDMSESLTGYPVFNNREGSLEFYVTNRDKDWTLQLNEISSFLHGKMMRAFLEDEPDYFYTGRFTVNEWKSEKDYSKIVIDYNLIPYKYYVTASDEEWLWDPFNFFTGVILTRQFKDIAFTSPTSWYKREYSAKLLQKAPICPIFNVTNLSSSDLKIHFVCPEEGIDETETITKTGMYEYPDMYMTGKSFYVEFMGSAKLSITFRSGRI